MAQALAKRRTTKGKPVARGIEVNEEKKNNVQIYEMGGRGRERERERERKEKREIEIDR